MRSTWRVRYVLFVISGIPVEALLFREGWGPSMTVYGHQPTSRLRHPVSNTSLFGGPWVDRDWLGLLSPDGCWLMDTYLDTCIVPIMHSPLHPVTSLPNPHQISLERAHYMLNVPAADRTAYHRPMGWAGEGSLPHRH